ncbi:hypothetical protein MANES_07G039097v8, partial [Manihot esculenta]
NALSTSLVALRLSKATAYSIRSASHGSVSGPSLCNPNSSSPMFKSSLMISLLRYSKGRRKRFLSVEYTTKLPFSATDAVSVLPTFCEDVILLRLMAAIFCHFLANFRSLLVLIILLIFFKN